MIVLRGRNNDDPLILQAKEAQASVLERFVAPSEYTNHAQRVVEGQRLMQSSTDIFLGWQSATGIDGTPRDFLHPPALRPQRVRGRRQHDLPKLPHLRRVCGQALARAHARTGDRFAIAGYLGTGTQFDNAIADFASKYAKQNARDYSQFLEALKSGQLTAPQAEPQINS